MRAFQRERCLSLSLQTLANNQVEVFTSRVQRRTYLPRESSITRPRIGTLLASLGFPRLSSNSPFFRRRITLTGSV